MISLFPLTQKVLSGTRVAHILFSILRSASSVGASIILGPWEISLTLALLHSESWEIEVRYSDQWCQIEFCGQPSGKSHIFSVGNGEILLSMFSRYSLCLGCFYEHACLWLREARRSFRESILAADIHQSFESMPSAGRLQEMRDCKEVKGPDGLILDNPRRQWRVGICPSFVSTGVCKGEGETFGDMDMCGSLWKDRGTLCCSYILLEFLIPP